MTVSTITTLDEWAAHPYGKAARIALVVLGLASAMLVLMMATMNTQAAWLLVLLVWPWPPPQCESPRSRPSSASSLWPR
ncbi:MAG: hypothetical protein ABWZ58_07985 [Acidimicrobiia bacterium]